MRVEEVDYVDECPDCGVKFMGMSPAEVRDRHRRICADRNAPLLELTVWPKDTVTNKP